MLELLVAFDFDPAAGPQSLPHHRVADDHAEILFTLFGDERLVKRAWFRSFRTREFFLFVTVVAVTVKSFIDASVVVFGPIQHVSSRRVKVLLSELSTTFHGRAISLYVDKLPASCDKLWVPVLVADLDCLPTI